MAKPARTVCVRFEDVEGRLLFQSLSEYQTVDIYPWGFILHEHYHSEDEKTGAALYDMKGRPPG